MTSVWQLNIVCQVYDRLMVIIELLISVTTWKVYFQGYWFKMRFTLHKLRLKRFFCQNSIWNI